jgi:hypothetical protein
MLMNARQYIETLKDGREVWYEGEKVIIVPDHRVLRRCVENRAREYDLHDRPECRELLSFLDGSGERRCVLYGDVHLRGEFLVAYILEKPLERQRVAQPSGFGQLISLAAYGSKLKSLRSLIVKESDLSVIGSAWPSTCDKIRQSPDVGIIDRA